MVVYSLRPLLAILVSLLAAGLILLSDRKRNVRETWTFLAAFLKFILVLSMLPTVLRGGEIVTAAMVPVERSPGD